MRHFAKVVVVPHRKLPVARSTIGMYHCCAGRRLARTCNRRRVPEQCNNGTDRLSISRKHIFVVSVDPEAKYGPLTSIHSRKSDINNLGVIVSDSQPSNRGRDLRASRGDVRRVGLLGESCTRVGLCHAWDCVMSKLKHVLIIVLRTILRGMICHRRLQVE